MIEPTKDPASPEMEAITSKFLEDGAILEMEHALLPRNAPTIEQVRINVLEYESRRDYMNTLWADWQANDVLGTVDENGELIWDRAGLKRNMESNAAALAQAKRLIERWERADGPAQLWARSLEFNDEILVSRNHNAWKVFYPLASDMSMTVYRDHIRGLRTKKIQGTELDRIWVINGRPEPKTK